MQELKDNVLKNEDNFIKNLFFTSTKVITDAEFNLYGIKNKNIMFFLNYVNERISSVSTLGCRNLGISLLGKLENIISYYDNMIQLFEEKDKNTKKLPKEKINYIRYSIKSNCIISEKDKNKYMKFLSDESDKEFVENVKLILNSLISNKYFETISDKLYEMLNKNKKDASEFDEISVYVDEYLALLIDYVGISIFEIKRILKDTYRKFFASKNEKVFLSLFEKFVEAYNKTNTYLLFIKMDKEFDEKLVTSLYQSKKDSFLIYSKSGLVKRLEEEKINNQKTLEKIMNKYVSVNDNHYFLYSAVESKDIWHAIKSFRQKIIEPFVGSMLYSGIRVNTEGRYIVVEQRENKKFINEYNYHDDIFKPLSQDIIKYSDVFKRYIIDNRENDINFIIDEAVQLLPYYKNSDSILTKFTNTWFALETLFRKSSDMIVKSLDEYASKLVADRMISGYIYLTSVQIKTAYKGFVKKSNNYVENIYLNYVELETDECSYLVWKYKNVLNIINSYESVYDNYLREARELLDNAYRLRNKQFHGSKDSQLETMAGFLYDIVNDTISYYIDYLDVYKNDEISFSALYNIIKNIKLIKSSLMNDATDDIEKITILYDSVRKL